MNFTLALRWMLRQLIASNACERVSFILGFGKSQRNLDPISRLTSLAAGRDSKDTARSLTTFVRSKVLRALLLKRKSKASFAQDWRATTVCLLCSFLC
jgi:hypothetical protein